MHNTCSLGGKVPSGATKRVSVWTSLCNKDTGSTWKQSERAQPRRGWAWVADVFQKPLLHTDVGHTANSQEGPLRLTPLG